MKRNPSPVLPTYNPTPSISVFHRTVSAVHRYVRLGEFRNLDEIGRGISPAWHAVGHLALNYEDSVLQMDTLLSPAASDDLFWKWHLRIDECRANWLAGGGPDTAYATTLTPAPNTTHTGNLTEIIIAFDKKVSAGWTNASLNRLYIPVEPRSEPDTQPPFSANKTRTECNTIQLKAGALTVNGSPATHLYEHGFDASGVPTSTFTVFRFTGFSNPGTGTVSVVLNDLIVYTNIVNFTQEIVLTNTASYKGTNWTFTRNP